MLKEGVEEEAKEKQRFEEAIKDSKFSYGFLGRYSDIFRGEEALLKEACDLNPLEVPRAERMKLKFIIEEEKFDPDRYACDNYDEEQLVYI
jgi:hypothetical protein